MNSINIKIGGLQGEGVDKTGIILSKFLTRLGFSTFGYREYRSLIKGGHTTYQIHASPEPVYSQLKKVDLLIALDKNTVSWHQDELDKRSLIIYDPNDFQINPKKLVGDYLALPLLEITKNAGGIPLMANMTAAGVICACLDLPLSSLNEQIGHIFSEKGEVVINANHMVAKAGYEFFNLHFTYKKRAFPLKNKKVKQVVLFGNEAISAGAVAGGMKFFSAYPMTPSSSILHYLAAYAKEMKLVVKHSEDEIGAVNMAVGASFAGVRAMTATSGGGFCLMTESLGLAGISEIPLVIIESQRPGPALGMPTWTAQGDLLFVINASQDEFPRIVLAPGSPEQAFALTALSLQLAEEYQMPVVVLVDKYISESIATCPEFEKIYKHKRYSLENNPGKNFLRYKVNSNGISPRTLPGQKNGSYACNSYEHSSNSFGTEMASDRVEQMDKRAAKMKALVQIIPAQLEAGDKEAKNGILCWGSTLGPAMEAIKTKKNIKLMHLSWLWPFPTKQVNRFLKSCDRVLLVEGNSEAQLGKLIKQELKLEIQDKLLKYDGKPFYPEEILARVKEF